MAPSDYFRRQGWINCEPDEPNLRGLADFIGADRLLWASDFPHPDGKFPGAVDALFGAVGLDGEEIGAYAGGNARSLYRLPTG
jgi:predicted TIM-barrel fold metal-dependent hydrolase